MSSIGYYRYKLDSLAAGTHEIPLYINGNLEVTHTVVILPFCTGSKLIKFIDKNGQYRFFAFNKYWEGKDSPALLGRTNKLITSILSSQSNSHVVGYKNERSLSLVADEVTAEQLEILSDLWTSPKVYLYIGSGTDEDKDWLQVEVTGDGINKRRKLNSGTVNAEIKLPEWFNITLL